MCLINDKYQITNCGPAQIGKSLCPNNFWNFKCSWQPIAG